MLAPSDNSDCQQNDQTESSLPSSEDYEDIVQVRRSKSLEKIKELRNETKAKRPETAPPNLTIKSELTSFKTETPSKLSCRLNQLNRSSESNQIHDFKSTNSENLDKSDKVISWHEHIYKKPPKAPTPHFINDILGWQMSGSLTKRQMLAPEADFCGDDHSDRNNNNSITNNVHPYQNVESSTLQQLLNLSVTSPTSDHSENYQHPQNYSQTAVLPYSNNYLTDISTPVNKITAPYHYNNGKMGRSLSLSETSEDESVVSDQPLNLCVPKSRDSSPNEQRIDKVKKSKHKVFNIFSLHSRD